MVFFIFIQILIEHFLQANSWASGLVLHYLSTSHKRDARLTWIKKFAHGNIVMFYALTLCLLCIFFFLENSFRNTISFKQL